MLFLRLIRVHGVTDAANVDVDGTFFNTSATSHAHASLVIFVRKVLELVHEPLANPLGLFSPGVVAGAVLCEQG